MDGWINKQQMYRDFRRTRQNILLTLVFLKKLTKSMIQMIQNNQLLEYQIEYEIYI